MSNLKLEWYPEREFALKNPGMTFVAKPVGIYDKGLGWAIWWGWWCLSYSIKYRHLGSQ